MDKIKEIGSSRHSVSLPYELFEFAKQEGYSLSALLKNSLESKQMKNRCNDNEEVNIE